jgi:hypothetical protein
MTVGWGGLASTSGGRPGLFGEVGVVVVLCRVRVTAFSGYRGGCVLSIWMSLRLGGMLR